MTTVDMQQQRIKMVDGQVRTTDVTDIAILTAMLSVPREAFVPANRRLLAYVDEDIQIAPGRFLMQASPFARLVQLAALRPGDRVLDIGCGMGYSSAVLSRIAGSVVALESDEALAGHAEAALSAQGYDNVTVVKGPLVDGHPAKAPYDAILINGSVDVVPAALTDQLAEGGRLVAVIGEGNAGRTMLYLREGGLVSSRRAFNTALKPLAAFARVAAFEF